MRPGDIITASNGKTIEVISPTKDLQYLHDEMTHTYIRNMFIFWFGFHAQLVISPDEKHALIQFRH